MWSGPARQVADRGPAVDVLAAGRGERSAHTKIAGGKWQGFQTQPHIDYGDVERHGPNAPWQQPETDNVALKDVLFPAVKRIDPPARAARGVAVDGSASWWPHGTAPAVLPVFSPYQTRPAQYIEVFNRGRAPFDYRVRTGASWLTAARQTPGGRSPRPEYRVSLFTTGPVTVYAYLSPRNNALPTDGLTYAVSFDDAAPQRVNVTKATGADDGTMNAQWARHTSDNVNVTGTVHRVTGPGVHVLKFWMVDPTVVLQNLVIDTGGLEPSYLGPPESLRLD